jgi:hypothetical protein
MEFPSGKLKDLTEIYYFSDSAASQYKNMTGFSNLHHKDDLVCMPWDTSSQRHMTRYMWRKSN